MPDPVRADRHVQALLHEVFWGRSPRFTTSGRWPGRTLTLARAVSAGWVVVADDGRLRLTDAGVAVHEGARVAAESDSEPLPGVLTHGSPETRSERSGEPRTGYRRVAS